MPTWPPVPGRRSITLEATDAQIQHLDTLAAYYGMSRAAYMRSLIIKHRDRSADLTLTDDLAGARTRSFELPDQLISYLDSLATANACSRAAVIRAILGADIRRQGPVDGSL